MGEHVTDKSVDRLRPESLLCSQRYVALPPFRPPRLLVAAPTRLARWRLARSLVEWGAVHRGPRRAAVRLAGAVTTGLCVLLPGHEPLTHVVWRNPKLDGQLRAFICDAHSTVVQTQGDGRAHVHAVVTGPRGSVFIKAVDTASSARSLANDAIMLRHVGAGCAPRLLHDFIEADAGFLVTEVVRPDRRPPSLTPDPRGVAVLESLPHRGAEFGGCHPWIASSLTPECPPEVARWSEVSRRRRWPVVITHGDFLPCNMATRQDGTPVLVDWENGSLVGFPGVDAAAWMIGVGARFGHVPAHAISSAYVSWVCSRECSGLRIAREEARAILALTAYRMYRGDRSGANGPMGRGQRAMVSLWTQDT